jgi:hypothetical protein
VGVGNGEQATGNSFNHIFPFFYTLINLTASFLNLKPLFPCTFPEEKIPKVLIQQMFYSYSASPK